MCIRDRLNFIWMCSLCQLPVAKNHNFWQILTLFVAPVPTPFYRWGPNLVCWIRPKVYTYPPNFIWMCLLCRLPVAKNHNFWQILTILGAPVPTPLYRWGPNLVCWSRHISAKFHLNNSLCRLPMGKNHNFGQILTFLRAPVSTPFYQWGPNLVCYSRSAVYAYVPNFVSIGLFCRPMAAKNPQFLPYFAIFWTSAFSGVANWQQWSEVSRV